MGGGGGGGDLPVILGNTCHVTRLCIVIAVEYGSVIESTATFSFRTATQKRIAVFSRNFAGMYTRSWECAV